ncbi:MAG: pentapeptide repeat-containing protein [candidate division Zixibacteria bacterium]
MRFVNFSLLILLFILPFNPARSDNNIEIKDWSEYTDEEIDSLRTRWTEENVNLLLKVIKKDRAIRGYFFEIPSEADSMTMKGYDMRFIRLSGKDLTGLDLGSSCLQGAIFGADYKKGKGRSSIFIYSILENTKFQLCNLQKAEMPQAFLRGAFFFGADLRNAKFLRANLTLSNFTNANMEEAYFGDADLENARLWRANLKKSFLVKTNLKDADLLHAIFDSTYLWGSNLHEAKNIRYIRWGDKLSSRYVIGEEVDADATKSKEDYIKAEITYRDLKYIYQEVRMPEIAAEFNYRENEIRTKRSSWYIAGLRIVFLKWTYGYGSKPFWLFPYSIFIIILFSLPFLILTFHKNSKSGIIIRREESNNEIEIPGFGKGKLILRCLYFSLLSFVTFGYGPFRPHQWMQFFLLEPVEYKPIRWARIFVGLEALLGVYILALLVTVIF